MPSMPVPGPGPFALASALAILLALAVPLRRPAWIVAWPRLVLALAALVSLGAALLLVRPAPLGVRLEIDPSAEPLLPRGDPARDAYRDAVRDFGDDEVFVIAMSADDVFSRGSLEALRRVGDRITRMGGVRDVQSLVDVTSFRFVPEEDWVEVRPLVEEIPTEPAALAALRERALSDPLYRRSVVSEDGRTAALNVSFRKMTDREFIAADLDGRIQEVLREEARDGRSFAIAGRPHVKAHVFHTMRADLLRLVPLALLAMGVVLALATGGLLPVALSLGVAALAAFWTLAALVLLGRPLTILTTLLAPNLIVIGSVYGVHVLERHREEARAHEDPTRAALRCLEHVRGPVLISGATTLLGFASLLWTEVPAVAELGAFSLFGIASVTVLSLTLIPAVLVLLPREIAIAPGVLARPLAPLTAHAERAIDGALARIEEFAARRSAPVLAGVALLTLGAALLVPSLRIDTDYLSYFSERSRVRRDFERVNERLAGAVPLFVVLTGEGPGAFREPAALAAIEQLEEEAAALPGVSHVRGLSDLLRRLNRAMAGDAPEEERIPASRAGVAELLNLVPKQELSRLSTVNQARANIVVRTGEVGSSSVEALAAGLERLLGALPPGLRGEVTGNAILLARSADGIAGQQLGSIGFATLSIFALVSVALRSLRLGVVAMVPNVVPVVLFFGLLGAGVAPLSLPTSLIASVALGITVDDTMHFLARYRADRRRGLSPEAAARQATRTVGRGALTASAMLCAGFLVIALSGFATLQQFGLLSAWTMAVCSATELLLLPALLVRVRP
jgi:predicted RND superfamily exporter protein